MNTGNLRVFKGCGVGSFHDFDYRTPLHCCHPYAAFQAVRLFIACVEWGGIWADQKRLGQLISFSVRD